MESPAIVITGALTGIGRATALAFADSAAHLVVSGRREAEGKAKALLSLTPGSARSWLSPIFVIGGAGKVPVRKMVRAKTTVNH